MQIAATDRKAMAAAVAVLLALLVALAALLDLGPFADDELTVAEFLAEGDEICADAHDSFRDIQKGPPRTPEEAADLTGALIDSAESELSEIRALGPPASLERAIERYFAARERGIVKLEAGLKAARDADAQAYEETQAQLAASQPERFDLARKVGFEECSKPLVSPEELRRQAQPPEESGLDAPPEVNNPPT